MNIARQTRIPASSGRVWRCTTRTIGNLLGDALKRRCLHLHIGYPDRAREERILAARVPELDATLRAHLVAFVQRLRTLELRKSPSISETIDWARSLLLLHVTALDTQAARETLNILLKYESDIEATARQIDTLVRESARN